MSALWTLGCWRDRLRGVVGRGRPRRPASRSYLMPRVRGFRVRTRGLPYEREALAQWGSLEAMVQRPAPDPDPFPPRVDQCARGWGSTGRGLCVLHEPPTPMEYTRRSCSGTPPSWSGRWAEGGIESVVSWRRSRPRRPASRSYLMPRVRGFRVRTGDLPYEREALTQGRARRPGLNWSSVARAARSPGKPPNRCLRSHDTHLSQKS